MYESKEELRDVLRMVRAGSGRGCWREVYVRERLTWLSLLRTHPPQMIELDVTGFNTR